MAAVLGVRLEQRIASEAAPGLQLGTNPWIIADDCDQLALAAATQNSNQLRQQTRGEGLSSNVQIDVSLHRKGHSRSLTLAAGVNHEARRSIVALLRASIAV